jgi:hypothetical protein
LRRQQYLSKSRNSQHFIEPERSALRLQETTTFSFPEPAQSCPRLPTIFFQSTFQYYSSVYHQIFQVANFHIASIKAQDYKFCYFLAFISMSNERIAVSSCLSVRPTFHVRRHDIISSSGRRSVSLFGDLATDWTIRSSNHGSGKNFILLKNVRTGSKVHPPHLHTIPRLGMSGAILLLPPISFHGMDRDFIL